MIAALKHNHLGDLINILQRNKTKAIYVPDEAKPMLEFLLSLFPNPPAITDIIGTPVLPTWTQDVKNPTGTLVWYRPPYVKAVNLPKQRRRHVACQFDARSKPWWTKTIPDDMIRELASRHQGMINIGDRIFDFMENRVDASLQEKFEIIATARFYVGIDSGLSHLALMTNTPTYIVYQKHCPWFFYPDGTTFVNRVDQIPVEIIPLF
jgi:hypothetical protein